MEEILQRLKELGIQYELIEHKAVFNMEEMDALGKDFFKGATICKNLFLIDQKGKRHFLVTMKEEKQANLAEIAKSCLATKLSFASEERLKKYLNLTPGAVTPLAIINDEQKAVEVILDKDLFKEEKIGVHPGVNTATVIISPADLEKYIKANGNKLKMM